ncbi:MAG: alanine--tRNA ligase, partial [Pseudomonadota bacterium]
MPTLNEIRSTFLNFFDRNDHEVVASSPLVPRNDPTLMFVNSGMVQFKNLFTGVETRDYQRATTSQKCVRAGGKHNDLDNVGYTARHHTFFEMLGNFSFGDYFKSDAIPFAWDLLTKDFEIDASKLLVTVYHTDDEAAEIWKKHAGLSDDRIIRIPTDDNFWSMGSTGPCGPCTEIFYDHGPEIWGGPPGSLEEDGDRFIEIWNLVFMQNERFEDGSQIDLEMQSIDTGMGLERIGALLQGKHDNYDTDLMRSLIEASAHATSQDPDGPGNVHHRVIADHLRSTSFLIADGVMPSNEGRGYVLRRIMRRAMRHAHLLGAQDPVMHRLVPTLVGQMGQAFPELGQAQALIEETLELEEKRFKQTLDRGLRLLDDELNKLPDGSVLPGEVAFKLYDTYGFPLDLTQDALREKEREVDIAGFDAAMAEQKAKARAAWAGSGETADAGVWLDVAEETGPTDFLGYDTEIAEGQIVALVQDGKRVEMAKIGERVQIVFNQTPFYAESGGQVGDTGT